MSPLVFVSHTSADTGLRDELCAHLAIAVERGILRVWHSGMLRAGQVAAHQARVHLEQAQVVAVLASVDYVKNRQTREEMEWALARAHMGAVRVVPILARPFSTTHTSLAGLKVLPSNGKPVTAWSDRELAWTEITSELLDIAEQGSSRPVSEKGETERLSSSPSPGGRRGKLDEQAIQRISEVSAAKTRLRELRPYSDPTRLSHDEATAPDGSRASSTEPVALDPSRSQHQQRAGAFLPADRVDSAPKGGLSPTFPSLKSVDIADAEKSIRTPTLAGAARSKGVLVGTLVSVAALIGVFTLRWAAGGDDSSGSVAAPTGGSAPTGAPFSATALPGDPCPPAMVFVLGGKFRMGSSPEEIRKKQAEESEVAHDVTVSSFCIDRMEVTVRDYRACVLRRDREASCPEPEATKVTKAGEQCNARAGGREDHPINCVDWNMAHSYCRAASKRLPTEAEWEYAARGTTGRRYPWGDAPPAPGLLNACGAECGERFRDVRRDASTMYADSDPWIGTAPVGATGGDVSAFGVRDMGGNVHEWMADWYGPYDLNKTVDPVNSVELPGERRRVLRGAAWTAGDALLARAADRNAELPAEHKPVIGFRCAQSVAK